jgi:hypothetical protein
MSASRIKLTFLAMDSDAERIQRIMRATPRPESVREPEEVFLVDRIQQRDQRSLDNFVFESGDRERALPAVRLGNVYAPRRQCPIRSPLDSVMQVLDIAFEGCTSADPHPARRSP